MKTVFHPLCYVTVEYSNLSFFVFFFVSYSTYLFFKHICILHEIYFSLVVDTLDS